MAYMLPVEFKDFALDPRVVIAPIVYGREPHYTTSYGAEVSNQAMEELMLFVELYAEYLGVSNPFFRLDVYITDNTLMVLECNTAFVDGWGTALNLSRATSIEIEAYHLNFPSCLALDGGLDNSKNYLPELKLFIAELRELDNTNHHLCTFPGDRSKCTGPVYVYGRVNDPNVWPINGLANDDKRKLAQFASYWPGDLVQIPKTYTCIDTEWGAVPKDVYVKFTDKDSPECQRTKHSVLSGKPSNDASFWRECFNSGKVLAQERIRNPKIVLPGNHNGLQAQLVVLTNGNVLTGYVQYGTGSVINDNSIHGPLSFGS